MVLGDLYLRRCGTSFEWTGRHTPSCSTQALEMKGRGMKGDRSNKVLLAKARAGVSVARSSCGGPVGRCVQHVGWSGGPGGCIQHVGWSCGPGVSVAFSTSVEFSTYPFPFLFLFFLLFSLFLIFLSFFYLFFIFVIFFLFFSFFFFFFSFFLFFSFFSFFSCKTLTS